jgi:hypothetical protein
VRYLQRALFTARAIYSVRYLQHALFTARPIHDPLHTPSCTHYTPPLVQWRFRVYPTHHHALTTHHLSYSGDFEYSLSGRASYFLVLDSLKGIVLILYCTHTVLYSHCTVLTVLYSYCTVLILYCTHTLYCTPTVLYSHCTALIHFTPYSYTVLHSRYCTHTVLYSHCTVLIHFTPYSYTVLHSFLVLDSLKDGPQSLAPMVQKGHSFTVDPALAVGSINAGE